MAVTPKEQLERANFIIERASLMNRAKDVYSRKWSSYERVWKMAQEGRTGEDEWRADLPETWTFATIKTAQAAFVDSKVIPTIIRHQDDPKSKAEDLRDLYTDIADKGNLDIELYYARLDAFKLGNGFLFTPYVKDKRTVWDIDKFDPKTEEFKWKKKEINEFDDPKSFRVSPYLVLVDDLARGEMYRDACILEVMGRDQAEEKYGNLVDFDNVPGTTQLLSQLTAPASSTVAETDGTGLRGTEFEGMSKYQFFAPGFDWSDDVVEILHYWNQGVRTPSGASDSHEILVNGHPAKVDTKREPSPIPYIHKKIPLTHVRYSPYSGDEFWAAGIIEIGRSDANEIKKKREMMTDRQKLSLFSPAFSDVNDEIDQKNLKLKPLSVIRTKGGVPKYAQIPGVTNADLTMLDRDESSFKRATGIDERILGIQADAPRLTATEVSFLREAALKRLRDFAFLYKNALLHSEIRFKLSLFKQYFSDPLAREDKQKNDKANRVLKNKFKEFKVKSNNTYVSKQINPNFFEGEVDVDLDLQLLLPMTQAQLVTMWGQLIRDSVPAVQAGILDWSVKKMYEGYAEALGRNHNSLKEDSKSLSIEMAEREHEMYASENSSNMGVILPNGTDKKYLSGEHILKHEELLDADVSMEDKKRARLLDHMKKDIENWKQMQGQLAPPPQQLSPEQLAGVGGLTPQSPRSPQPTQTPTSQPTSPAI